MAKLTAKQRASLYKGYAALIAEAQAAGEAALAAATPVPMIVTQHANPLNDASPVTRAYYVEGGTCGFAWVSVFPGGSSFARWARKNAGFASSTSMGTYLWVRQGGQSMDRKEAYARAYVKVLQAAGIQAYLGSRMD